MAKGAGREQQVATSRLQQVGVWTNPEPGTLALAFGVASPAVFVSRVLNFNSVILSKRILLFKNIK